MIFPYDKNHLRNNFTKRWVFVLGLQSWTSSPGSFEILGPGSLVVGSGSWIPSSKSWVGFRWIHLEIITRFEKTLQVWQLLGSVKKNITKCDRYYKMSQSVTGIKSCDNYYKVRRNKYLSSSYGRDVSDVSLYCGY